MFYAELTKDRIEFRAFETEREASQWLLEEIGEGYADAFWIDGWNGHLHVDSERMFDFTARVHTSLFAAIRAQAHLDPEAAAPVLRAMAEACEREPRVLG